MRQARARRASASIASGRPRSGGETRAIAGVGPQSHDELVVPLDEEPRGQQQMDRRLGVEPIAPVEPAARREDVAIERDLEGRADPFDQHPLRHEVGPPLHRNRNPDRRRARRPLVLHVPVQGQRDRRLAGDVAPGGRQRRDLEPRLAQSHDAPIAGEVLVRMPDPEQPASHRREPYRAQQAEAAHDERRLPSSPSWVASNTASLREWTASLAYRRFTWVCTVPIETPRRRAISA